MKQVAWQPLDSSSAGNTPVQAQCTRTVLQLQGRLSSPTYHRGTVCQRLHRQLALRDRLDSVPRLETRSKEFNTCARLTDVEIPLAKANAM